jgi:hypothetical protein
VAEIVLNKMPDDAAGQEREMYAEARQWVKRTMEEMERQKKAEAQELEERLEGWGEEPSNKTHNATAAAEAMAGHSNATYSSMMQHFGVSKEYLQKVKGEDKEANLIMDEHFVTGARYPQWVQDLEEMERNGTWRHLCPLPATAVPFAMPTGRWRPWQGDPASREFVHAGFECDDYSEAAAAGFTPHNFAAHRAYGGICATYPEGFRREIDEAAAGGERWALELRDARSRNASWPSWPDSPARLAFRQSEAALSGSFERGSEVRAAAALGQQWALDLVGGTATAEEQDKEQEASARLRAIAAALSEPVPMET